MEIPSITYSDYFGPVNKVRWYEVTDTFGEYDVSLVIQTSRRRSSQLIIQNRATSNGTQYSTNIPANVGQDTIDINTKILHVPTLKAVEYVVINQV